jgi:hypothetical protein
LRLVGGLPGFLSLFDNPRLIDFSFAHFFVAIPEMDTDKTYQLVIITGLRSFSQKWNRHESFFPVSAAWVWRGG